MNDTEPDVWDDDDALEAVARALRKNEEAILAQGKDTADRIAALDAGMATATGALGDLVRTEYADALTGLEKAVAGFGTKLDGSGQTVQGLKAATAGLDTATKKTSEEWARLKLLADKLDKIVKRPAPAEKQRRARQIFGAGGFVAGALLVILGLWALPDGMETGAARMIMGASHWDAAWRMMDAHNEKRAENLRVLSWIQDTPEDAAVHRECRDLAWGTGKARRCTVVFKPRSQP